MEKNAGFLFSVIALLFFYLSIGFSLYLCGVRDWYRQLTKKDLMGTGLVISLLTIIVAVLISRENWVYFWDNGAYWFRTVDFTNLLFEDPKAGLYELYRSMNQDEYNKLYSLLIAAPLSLLGKSYAGFVLLNTILFYIPASFHIAFLIDHISKKYMLKGPGFPWVLAYTLFFPVMLFPLLDGYLDIVTVIPLTIAFLLVVDRDFQKVEWKKDICLGLMLCWVVLTRRYFAYAILGGAVFLLIDWFFPEKTVQKQFAVKVKDMLITCILPFVIMIGFFSQFLIMSVFNNYSAAYAAYKTVGWTGEWIKLCAYFGWIFVLLILVGFCLSFHKRIFSVYLAFFINIVIICALFFRVQDMGEQHYYIITVPVICLSWLSISFILGKICNKQSLQRAVKYMLLAIIVFNSLAAVGIGTVYKQGLGSFLWTERTYYPKIRNDKNTLQQLENYLQELDQGGKKGVYCLASSGILNNEVLDKLNPFQSPPFLNYNAAQIDLRDGFNTQFFDADVILSCTPEQHHLPAGQEVILALNRVFQTENHFRDHYSLEKKYILDGGIEVDVFVKQSCHAAFYSSARL